MKLILISGGKYWAKVDDEDYEKLNKLSWALNSGYARSNVHSYMHTEILGQPPDGMRPHHKDEDKLNNQKSNLEFISTNLHHHLHRPRRSKYLYVGVYVNRGRIFASMTINGKNCYLGSFETQQEAAEAYDKKALELYGSNAKLNFPCKVHS